MRAILALSMLLGFASPYVTYAELPRPRFTTLIVEYVGETDRLAPPVIISISKVEGKWYREHLLAEPGHFVVEVEVVRQSVLNDIAELPLLKRALESARPSGHELNTALSVSFTAGVGHECVETILDKQSSAKILKGIGKIVVKYPSLKNELQEIEYKLK